ncbi:MAG: ERF family protein [Myxococcota bacterium]
MCIDLTGAAPPRVASELAAALARAQGEFGTIRKAHTAQVQTRTGGAYSYSFADLAAVLEAVRPALSKHELALVQLPAVRMVDGAAFVAVETILAHSSGASISTTLELPVDAATPQAIGSGMTYARRYSVLALLGIAAEDEDDDAQGAQPRAPEPRAGRERKAPPKGEGERQTASPAQLKLLWAKARERAREFVAEGDAEAEKQLGEEILRASLPAGIESTKDLGVRQVDGVLERIATYAPTFAG